MLPASTIVSNDDTATHLLLRLTPSLTPIGTLRLYPAPDGSHLILGRVAILAAYRKYGLGKVLMLAGHERAVREPYLIQSSPAMSPVESSPTESLIPSTITLDSNSKVNGADTDRSTITVKLGAQLYAMPFYARFVALPLLYPYRSRFAHMDLLLCAFSDTVTYPRLVHLFPDLVTSQMNLSSTSHDPFHLVFPILPILRFFHRLPRFPESAFPLRRSNLRLALTRQDHVASRSAACSPLLSRCARRRAAGHDLLDLAFSADISAPEVIDVVYTCTLRQEGSGMNERCIALPLLSIGLSPSSSILDLSLRRLIHLSALPSPLHLIVALS